MTVVLSVSNLFVEVLFKDFVELHPNSVVRNPSVDCTYEKCLDFYFILFYDCCQDVLFSWMN
jgi:hypothetical protein